MFRKSYWFEKIKKNPFLYSLGLIVKRRKNQAFINSVLGLDNAKYGTTIHFANLGAKNPDTMIEVITIQVRTYGFFACLKAAMEYLIYADRFGLSPVIHFKDTCYNEEYPIHGTDNAFEYYFQQPCAITLKEASISRHVFYATLRTPPFVSMDGYALTQEQLTTLAALYRKYIRLNRFTKQYMDEQILSLFKGKKTLGVHYRGTDFGFQLKNHPVSVSVEDSLHKARQVFEAYGFERIFLATDDVRALSEFQTEFGAALLYYPDVLRSEGILGVHVTEVTRKDHHYLLGLEVLRDMLTLCSCEGLISGLSQVSYAAQIAKLSEGKEYLPLCIISNGINREGMDYTEKLIHDIKKDLSGHK
jgi:hypothetical protein